MYLAESAKQTIGRDWFVMYFCHIVIYDGYIYYSISDVKSQYGTLFMLAELAKIWGYMVKYDKYE